MIYDYLIIGAGIAGLNAARYIPEDKKVLVVCKKAPWECNTFYALNATVPPWTDSGCDCDDFSDYNKYDEAASRIQRNYLICRYNPEYKYCRKRLEG